MNQSEPEFRPVEDSHTKLPAAPTSFVGRQSETMEVVRLIESSRLVTLTGAAGCGKTRLALRAAEEVILNYPDGVHWIGLAGLDDPALIPQTIAKAFQIAEQPDRSSLERLLDALRDQKLLLVLDNCEHLLNGCAHLVESLLGETEVKVLATSREPLGMAGERLYPLAPLALPPGTISTDHIGDIRQYDAIQLFIDRARAILPKFGLSDENAGAVAKICHKLDGIPLAIELASARLNVLTVEQIAARLEDHFELLAPASHLTISQHDTLQAAIEWSHNLLSQAEQILFRRLSVFAAGCTLPAVESVCSEDGIHPEQVLELLSSLVDKSIINADTLQPGEARYSLLGTIRQFAGKKLAESGEKPVTQEQLLEYYLNLVEEVEQNIKGQYQQLWLNWLENEYENIRSTLAWSLKNGRIEAGLRIGVALYQFWTIRDYVEEGSTWLERLLEGTDERTSPVLRAKALAYAAFLAGFRGNTTVQSVYGRQAAALAEAAGEKGKPALVWALAAQAHAARARGDYETEFTIARRVIQLQREIGNLYELGLELTLYSVPAMALGKYKTAREMLDEGLPLLRQSGNPYRIAMALNYVGDLARCEGKHLQARTAYEESLSILSEIDAVRDEASLLHNLGHTLLHLGEVDRAHALFKESIDLHQQQGNRPGMAECLIGFAALAIDSELPAAGTRLLAAAEAMGGRQVTSQWAATRMEYEKNLDHVRARLSEEKFQAESEAGRALSLERALTFAKETASKSLAAQQADKVLDALTPREREVAALIAQAKSNGEIADKLVISKRTVETHITNIRTKLGFTRRSQIVRWAIDAGLVA